MKQTFSYEYTFEKRRLIEQSKFSGIKNSFFFFYLILILLYAWEKKNTSKHTLPGVDLLPPDHITDWEACGSVSSIIIETSLFSHRHFVLLLFLLQVFGDDPKLAEVYGCCIIKSEAFIHQFNSRFSL